MYRHTTSTVFIPSKAHKQIIYIYKCIFLYCLWLRNASTHSHCCTPLLPSLNEKHCHLIIPTASLSFNWSLCTYVNASLLLVCPVWQKCLNCIHPWTEAWTEREKKKHTKKTQSIFTHSCPFHHAQPTEVSKQQTMLKRLIRPCLTITIRVTER